MSVRRWIRTGRVDGTHVVIFGSVALPAWILPALSGVLYVALGIGLALWDDFGTGGGVGVTIFIVVSMAILGGVVLACLVIGIILAVKSIIRVNGGRVR